MKRIDKIEYETDWTHFYDDGYFDSEVSFSLDGKDYIIVGESPRRGVKTKWFLCDALEYATKRRPKHISPDFDTRDELLDAPLFDGRSFRERFEEAEFFYWYDVVDVE